MDGTQRQAKKRQQGLRFVGVVGIGIAMVAGLCVGIAQFVFSLKDYNYEIAASVGDLFGVPNAIFSAAAFVGVIAALYYQREELRLQRMELRRQWREMQKAADAQIKSQQALSRQADSLYMAAYLNAMSSLQDSYEGFAERTKSYAFNDRLYNLQATLALFLAQMQPGIEEITKRSGIFAPVDGRPAHYAVFTGYASRLVEISNRFIARWRTHYDPSRGVLAVDLQAILKDTSKELEGLVALVPIRFRRDFETILSTIEGALRGCNIFNLGDGDTTSLIQEHRGQGDVIHSQMKKLADEFDKVANTPNQPPVAPSSESVATRQ